MAYASVDDLREYLGYQNTNADDPLLGDALLAAEEAVNDYTGRTFGAVASSTARIFDGGTSRVLIDDAATLSAVEYSADRQTWTTLATTDWWAEPANSTPKTVVQAITPLARYVRVTGTWGHAATVPAQVKRATLMIAARLHKRRESVEGVAGFGDFGVVRISRTDADVATLLDGLRRADVVMGIA
jgi:hypothetical protein